MGDVKLVSVSAVWVREKFLLLYAVDDKGRLWSRTDDGYWSPSAGPKESDR